MTSPDGSGEVTVEMIGVVTSVEEALELEKQAATSLLEKADVLSLWILEQR